MDTRIYSIRNWHKKQEDLQFLWVEWKVVKELFSSLKDAWNINYQHKLESVEDLSSFTAKDSSKILSLAFTRAKYLKTNKLPIMEFTLFKWSNKSISGVTSWGKNLSFSPKPHSFSETNLPSIKLLVLTYVVIE